MFWIELIAVILVFALVLFLLIRQRIQDSKFLRKSVKEALSVKMRESLEQESSENKRKKEKFDQLLKKYGVND